MGLCLQSQSWLARVSLTILALLAASVYAYYAVRRQRGAVARLVASLPVYAVHALVPLLFDWQSEPISVCASCYLGIRLPATKVLALCFNRGPLTCASADRSIWKFCALVTCPVIPAGTNVPSATGCLCTSQLLRNAAAKWLGFGCTVMLAWAAARLHIPGAASLANLSLCWGMWACLGLIMDILAVYCRSVLDLDIAPHFDAPPLSTSLGDFWGRRWNITQSAVLRALVYDPIVEGRLTRTTPLGGTALVSAHLPRPTAQASCTSKLPLSAPCTSIDCASKPPRPAVRVSFDSAVCPVSSACPSQQETSAAALPSAPAIAGDSDHRAAVMNGDTCGSACAAGRRAHTSHAHTVSPAPPIAPGTSLGGAEAGVTQQDKATNDGNTVPLQGACVVFASSCSHLPGAAPGGAAVPADECTSSAAPVVPYPFPAVAAAAAPSATGTRLVGTALIDSSSSSGGFVRLSRSTVTHVPAQAVPSAALPDSDADATLAACAKCCAHPAADAAQAGRSGSSCHNTAKGEQLGTGACAGVAGAPAALSQLIVAVMAAPPRKPTALRRALGVLAVFAFSGFEHELFYWYVNRRLPACWAVFFIVHGILVVLEQAVFRMLRAHQRRLQPPVTSSLGTASGDIGGGGSDGSIGDVTGRDLCQSSISSSSPSLTTFSHSMLSVESTGELLTTEAIPLLYGAHNPAASAVSPTVPQSSKRDMLSPILRHLAAQAAPWMYRLLVLTVLHQTAEVWFYPPMLEPQLVARFGRATQETAQALMSGLDALAGWLR